jgi:hypothetical protein
MESGLMATTVTAATLKVTIIEEIILNRVDLGSKVVKRIESVTEVSRRIVEVPTSEITVLAFQATNPGAGTFDEADVRYIRITNLDDTNFVQLTFKNQDGNECAHKLDAGQTFICSADNAGGVAETHDASTSALSVVFRDLVDITALAVGGVCDIEIFVAGV